MGSNEESVPVQNEHSAILRALESLGGKITKDRFETGMFMFQKVVGEATVSIRFGLQDYSGADLIITNMTTLPEDLKGQGHGGNVLQEFLGIMKEQGMTDIRAVQVQEPSESFWLKNGFIKAPEPNPTNDFLYQGIIAP